MAVDYHLDQGQHLLSSNLHIKLTIVFSIFKITNISNYF